MEFNNYKNLWFDAMCIEDDKAWIFANNFNALFELNLYTSELSFLGSVTNEDMYTKGLYLNILKVDNRLVLVPFLAKSIGIYDIDTKEFNNIPLEMPGCKCYGAVTYNNTVFLVGYNSARIVSLDVMNKTVKYIVDCEDYFMNKKIDNVRYYFRKNSCVVDNYFYIASCVSNTIIKLDMQTEKVEFIELDIETDGLMTITFDGNDFWITKNVADSLIKWNEHNNECKDIMIPEGVRISSEIVCCEDEIIIFPTMGNHVMGLDKKNLETYIVEGFEQYIRENNKYPWGNQKFTCVIQNGRYIYSYFADEMKLLKYDTIDKTIDTINLDISNFDLEKKLFKSTMIFYENDNNSLDFFIKNI